MIGNDGWESSATDIIGIHDYDANPEHIAQRYGPEIEPEQLFDRRRPGGRVLTLDGYPHRGQPIMLTEFGGIAFATKRRAPACTKIWGYSTADDDRRVRAAVRRADARRSIHTALFSGFCYTQFADTFQEANGLLYADRTPKIPLEQIAQGDAARRARYIPGVVVMHHARADASRTAAS